MNCFQKICIILSLILLCDYLYAVDKSSGGYEYYIEALPNIFKDTEKAEILLHKALNEDSTISTYHKWLGVIYKEKGDYNNAILEFHKALKLNPDEEGIHCSLGQSYFMLENYYVAVRHHKRQLEIDSDNDLADVSLQIICLLYLKCDNIPPYRDETENTQSTNKEYIDNETKFRNTKWGMSSKKVKEIETAQFIEFANGIMTFKTKLNNYDAYIGYRFVKDTLFFARYIIDVVHSNKNDYISDYNTFKSYLKQKYGNPLDDGNIWKNDLYKDDPEDWGFAISIGHIIYYSKWENSDTKIILGLEGDNYEIHLIIDYYSKKYEYLEKEYEMSKVINGL